MEDATGRDSSPLEQTTDLKALQLFNTWERSDEFHPCDCDFHPLRDDFPGCDDDRTIEFLNGERLAPVPYGDGPFDETQESCPGCKTNPGNYHHPGCEFEYCPWCGEQYLWCDCLTEEKLQAHPGDQSGMMAEKLGIPKQDLSFYAESATDANATLTECSEALDEAGYDVVHVDPYPRTGVLLEAHGCSAQDDYIIQITGGAVHLNTPETAMELSSVARALNRITGELSPDSAPELASD